MSNHGDAEGSATETVDLVYSHIRWDIPALASKSKTRQLFTDRRCSDEDKTSCGLAVGVLYSEMAFSGLRRLMSAHANNRLPEKAITRGPYTRYDFYA